LRFSHAGETLFLSSAGQKTQEELGMENHDVIKVHDASKAQEASSDDINSSSIQKQKAQSSKKAKAKKARGKKVTGKNEIVSQLQQKADERAMAVEKNMVKIPIGLPKCTRRQKLG